MKLIKLNYADGGGAYWLNPDQIAWLFKTGEGSLVTLSIKTSTGGNISFPFKETPEQIENLILGRPIDYGTNCIK